MGPPVIADNKFVSIHSGASPFSTPGSGASVLRFASGRYAACVPNGKAPCKRAGKDEVSILIGSAGRRTL